MVDNSFAVVIKLDYSLDSVSRKLLPPRIVGGAFRAIIVEHAPTYQVPHYIVVVDEDEVVEEVVDELVVVLEVVVEEVVVELDVVELEVVVDELVVLEVVVEEVVVCPN